MKMKKRNLWMSMMLLLPVLTGILSMGSHNVDAAETDDVTVVINKKAFDSDQAMQTIQNTGVSMSEFDSAKPLPGVGFTPYNVTSEFNTQYKKALNGVAAPTAAQQEAAMKEAQKALAKMYTNDNWPKKDDEDYIEKNQKKTDANGQASFTLSSKVNNQYQAYMFFETFAPSNVKTKATPMLVVLPVTYKDQTLKTIQLYPKNIVKDEFNKEMVGHIKGDQESGLSSNETQDPYTITTDTGYTHAVGDQIKYYVDLTIPNGIGQTINQTIDDKTVAVPMYDQLQVTDSMNYAGTTLAENPIDKIEVIKTKDDKTTFETVEGLNNHYTLDVNNHFNDDKTKQTAGSEFTLSFNLAYKNSDGTINTEKLATALATVKALEPYAGETMRIYYTTTINEFAVPDRYMQNTAVYEFKKSSDSESHQDTSKAPQLVVGGKKFKKVDGSSKDGLAGAEFVIQLKKDVYGEEAVVNEKGEIVSSKKVVVGKEGQYIQYTTEPAATLNGEGQGKALESYYDPMKAKGVRYVTDLKNATVIKSGENGKIEVTGLRYAEEDAYAMVETKAPEGYAVVNKETLFTVQPGSFDGTDNLAETVIIENVREGFLPGTGGNGIYAYLAVGALVVAAAGFWFVRSRKDEAHF
ncbi:SpaH/EbpB family LPXTG-anchored major pilin [Enterococcus bulliens]